MINLVRGFRGKLEDHINLELPFQVTMKTSGNAVYDVSCFGVDAENKLSDDRYMVFFNQTASPAQEIQMNQDTFTVNLSKLPDKIVKLVFTVSIDGNGTMKQIHAHNVSISQNGNTVMELNMTGDSFSSERAIISIELYLKSVWRINVVANGFDGGLEELLKQYGGELAEKSAAEPEKPLNEAKKTAPPVSSAPSKGKVTVKYDDQSFETEITVNGQPFDTSRIAGKEITDWAYPFMFRRIKWNGFYDEMVAVLGGEKAFDLVFEGSDEALAELKEAWEDAPVNVVSSEQRNIVTIVYDAEALTTEITVNGQPFDTSRINGKEIEDWVYPFMMRKVKWNGIFDELKNVLGTDEYEIQFSGSREAMKVLMEDFPDTVTVNYRKSGNQISSNSEADELYKKAKELYDNNDYTQAFNYFKKAAEMGHAGAQCDLGDCYDSGEGVKQDQKVAVEWYKRSSAQKYAPGQRSLGLCYYYGDGVEQNYQEAVKLLSLAVEQNDAIAQWVLGECYYCGRGVNRDVSKARGYYKKSAEQNDPDGQFNYAILLCMEDEDEDIDWENGIKWMKKAADAGQKDAIDFLNDIDETNVSEDAVELEERASALDDEEKYEESFNLRLKAAELGNNVSLANIGWHYQYGNGVEQDYKKAFSYYIKAADMGNAWAQEKTGVFFNNGYGCVEDETKAYSYFKKSAEQGNVTAMADMGDCYNNGWGVVQNYTKANEWYQKAIEQGNSYAKIRLGENYFYGRGVTEDREHGLQLIEEAAEEGNEYAKKRYEELDIEDILSGAADTQKSPSLVDKAIDFAKSDTAKKIGKGALEFLGAFAQGYIQASGNMYDDEDE